VASTFWTTYLGCVLGSFLAFAFGAVVALAAPVGMDTMDGVKVTTGALGTTMLVLFVLSVISHNALNLYGAVLSIITSVQTFRARWIPTAQARVFLSVVILVGASIVAIALSADFVSHFVDLVVALLVVLVPWTAINLIDFYIVHKGVYDLESIFRFDGGIYGRYNRAAIAAYILGIVVQIPFMATSLYTGPVAAHLGGADLSWLAGLIVTGPIYLLLVRRSPAPAIATTPQPETEVRNAESDLAAHSES